MRTDTSLKYVLPQAIEYEEAVLASCFLGRANQVVELLKPEDFYRSSHQKIFTTIREFVDKKIQIELPLVVDALRDAGHLDEVGGAAFVAGITNTAPLAVNIEHYCKGIRDKALLRGLIAHSEIILKNCYKNPADIEAVIDNAQQGIMGIEAGGGFEAAVSYRDLSMGASGRYEDIYKRKDGITGINSGFYLLDYLTCGFQDTDLIIIASRPSMGKTALAQNIAGNAGRQDIPVAYFSLEMSKTQLFDRQIAGESGINSQKFRSGKFEHEDWERINRAQGDVYGWPVYIDDTGALHYREISRRARKLKKTKDVKLIIVDHLQLVKGDKTSTRDREIGSITASLKALAKELNLPVILLSQLNRELERRPNPYKRPRMSDLRDSGNIEQDADIVAFLYRPVVYEDTEDFPGHTELNIAKQRNGPTGMVKIRWDEKTTKFQNLEIRRE